MTLREELQKLKESGDSGGAKAVGICCASFNPLIDIAIDMARALEIISSSHRPRHSKEKYWLSLSIEKCAVVLATDTKIARQALSAATEKVRGLG